MARLCADGTDRCARRDPPSVARPGCRGAYYTQMCFWRIASQVIGACPGVRISPTPTFAPRQVRPIFRIFYKKGRFVFSPNFAPMIFTALSIFAPSMHFALLFLRYFALLRRVCVRLSCAYQNTCAGRLQGISSLPDRSASCLFFPRPKAHFCAWIAAPQCAYIPVFCVNASITCFAVMQRWLAAYRVKLNWLLHEWSAFVPIAVGFLLAYIFFACFFVFLWYIWPFRVVFMSFCAVSAIWFDFTGATINFCLRLPNLW